MWAGYVLDNFGSVDDAIKEMSKDEFHIEAAAMPGGTPTTIHMAMSDSTGNSAVVEYVDGKLCIYKGREYNVLTNAPTFEKQLAIRDYWEGVGGMNMLPGTNRSTDRFDRASFYLSVLPKDLNHNEALAAVFGIVRNCAVPMGISVPGQPEISSTQWMSVCDHRDKVYYFQLILSPATVWVDLKKPISAREHRNGPSHLNQMEARSATSRPNLKYRLRSSLISTNNTALGQVDCPGSHHDTDINDFTP